MRPARDDAGESGESGGQQVPQYGGGALALRFGVMRILMVGAVLSAASNLLFAWLATRGHDLTGLVFVISAEALTPALTTGHAWRL